MKKLEDFELAQISGGACPKGHVTVTVSIVWKGNALANKSKVSGLDVTLTDPEGPATAKMRQANNWKVSFYVKKGVQFTCWMDCRKYPFIKHWSSTWNAKTNQFVYYLS